MDLSARRWTRRRRRTAPVVAENRPLCRGRSAALEYRTMTQRRDPPFRWVSRPFGGNVNGAQSSRCVPWFRVGGDLLAFFFSPG